MSSRALAAVPALFLLYVLVLIPFTPGIGDITGQVGPACAKNCSRRTASGGVQMGQPRLGRLWPTSRPM
ncbi:hypothetical protein ACU4GD_11805 [Cupriavidus basilensis]